MSAYESRLSATSRSTGNAERYGDDPTRPGVSSVPADRAGEAGGRHRRGCDGRRVVILYDHPLLGEGLARKVHQHTGIRAAAVPARDDEAVAEALAAAPSLVIFELTEPLPKGALADLAPGAQLLDVSAAICRGEAGPGTPGLDQVLRAVGALAGGDSLRRRDDT